MGDGKQLTRHLPEAEGLTAGFLPGFQAGHDSAEALLHEWKLLIAGSQGAALALDFAKAGDHRPEIGPGAIVFAAVFHRYGS